MLGENIRRIKMAAEIVKFKICLDSKNPGQIIGKVTEGEHKRKICFLPEWCNDEEIGKKGKGFVKSDEGNYFVLMGISFEKD